MKIKLLAVFTIIAILFSTIASASTLSDPVFHSATIELWASKTADFSAETRGSKDSIKVTSVKLYQYNGSSWIFVCSLTPPSDEATNTDLYGADMDYSSSIGTGTYRLRATFCADGYSISRYSNSMTF